MADAPQNKASPKAGTLAAIVGLVAAAGLFVAVPSEESGRTVQATVAPSGEVAIKHVAGPQYLRAYLDMVGVATACDGITKGVRLGQSYTEAQCAALLERELVEHATHVMACTPGLRPDGHDHQRIAAVLLAYNIGWPNYCASTARARFNAADYRGACEAFLRFNGSITAKPVRGAVSSRRLKDGRYFNVLRGLDNRRQRERATCRLDLAP